MKNYTPIHIHTSRGSLFDSATSIDRLVAKLKAMGFKACTITDHGSMNGCLEFYNKCRQQGIQPILGCEFYLNSNRDKQADNPDEVVHDRENNHIVLLATSQEGYRNLLRIQGEAVMNGFYYKPRTTWEMIKANSKDLICTTACIVSEFGDYGDVDNKMKRYKDVFGDNLYLELQFNEMIPQHGYNKLLLDLGKKYNTKCIYGLDSHYLEKDGYYLQQILFCLKYHMTIKQFTEQNKQWQCNRLYIKDYTEVIREAIQDFKYDMTVSQIEEILDNTNEIADKCNFTLDTYKYQYPKVNLPKGFTDPKEYLKHLIYNGLKDKMVQKKIPVAEFKRYKDQLDYEYDIIAHKGKFSDYFILYRQIIDKVYELGGIVGPARGSASGCLLSYCLGLTNIDPLKHELYFSRFLNEERLKTDSPDIDTDIDSDVLGRVEEWLKEEYGKDKVCHIANFTTFKVKSLIKDIARVLDEDNNIPLINSITKQLPDSGDVHEIINSFMTHCNDTEAVAWIHRNVKIIELASQLQGCVRNVSSHASGRLITPGKLYEVIPIQRLKNEILTGYQEGKDDREISQAGGLKLDLLGLNTCSIINDLLKMIPKDHPKYITKDTVYDIPLDDPAVFKMFRDGDTLAIFQFESDSMRELLSSLRVENIAEVALVNAAFRPAIIQAGGLSKIIYNKFHPTEMIYAHPILKEILDKTYGVPVYQETLMEIFVKLGGFSMAEADKLRKVVKQTGNKASSNQQEEYTKFINQFGENCKKLGMKQKDLDDLLTMLAEYSSYAFNKAHAVGYAILGYVCMWLKKYFPIEFYCTLFNRLSADNTKTGENRIKKILLECTKKNIPIEYFNIERTEYITTIKDGKIYIGYNLIKGLSQANIEVFIKNKPCTIKDFIILCLEENIQKQTIETFCQLGILKYDDNSKRVLEFFTKLKDDTTTLRKYYKTDREFVLNNLIKMYNSLSTVDYTKLEHIQAEKTYLDLNFGVSKIELLEQNKSLQKDSFVFVSDIEKNTGDKFVVGEVDSVKVKKTKSGKTYKTVTFSDSKGSVTFKIWQESIAGTADILKEGTAIAIKLTKDNYGYYFKSKNSIMSLDALLKEVI